MLGSSRIAVTLLSQTAGRTAVLPHIGSRLFVHQSIFPPQLWRHYSSHRFSRNLEFFSAENRPLPKIKGSLSMSLPEQRPLTILISWLMSRDKDVKKFVDFYNDLGVDVLKLRVSPFDLLRPTKGSQAVAGQMLEFLHQNNRHSPILVHGFSAGCYVFCEGLVQIADDMERHGSLMSRIVGQVWDSPVDVYGIPDGVSYAITDNKRWQTSIKKYLLWYLRTQYTTATRHYERASEMMHTGFLKVPNIFLFSTTDVLSDPSMNAVVYEKLERLGIQVYVKCFEKSKHVSHFRTHPALYREEMLTFMQRVGMIKDGKTRVVAAP